MPVASQGIDKVDEALVQPIAGGNAPGGLGRRAEERAAIQGERLLGRGKPGMGIRGLLCGLRCIAQRLECPGVDPAALRIQPDSTVVDGDQCFPDEFAKAVQGGAKDRLAGAWLDVLSPHCRDEPACGNAVITKGDEGLQQFQSAFWRLAWETHQLAVAHQLESPEGVNP